MAVACFFSRLLCILILSFMWSRRDLSVLLSHCGQFERAKLEIECYMDSKEHQLSSCDDKVPVEQLQKFLSTFVEMRESDMRQEK